MVLHLACMAKTVFWGQAKQQKCSVLEENPAVPWAQGQQCQTGPRAPLALSSCAQSPHQPWDSLALAAASNSGKQSKKSSKKKLSK